jgi:hypothetical protein
LQLLLRRQLDERRAVRAMREFVDGQQAPLVNRLQLRSGRHHSVQPVRDLRLVGPGAALVRRDDQGRHGTDERHFIVDEPAGASVAPLAATPNEPARPIPRQSSKQRLGPGE